jgi:hypothetical protein
VKKRLGFLPVFVVLGAAAFLVTFHPSRPLYMRHRQVHFASGDGTILAGRFPAGLGDRCLPS